MKTYRIRKDDNFLYASVSPTYLAGVIDTL